MGANLSGKDIDNGDFMIKTSVADPEAGYAKEKFHADPKNGVIISEVDGPKGKRLEFSADWSVVSLDTKLQEGKNIEISEDPVSGKVEISAPDVGKVKHNDEFLDLAEGDGISLEKDGNDLKVSATNNGKVFVNDLDQIAGTLTDKLHFESPLTGNISGGNNKVITIVYDGVETEKIQISSISSPSNDTDDFNINGGSDDAFILSKALFDPDKCCPAFSFIMSPDLRANSTSNFRLRFYYNIASTQSGINKFTIKTEINIFEFEKDNATAVDYNTITNFNTLTWDQASGVYCICIEMPIEITYNLDNYLFINGRVGVYLGTETATRFPYDAVNMTAYLIGAEVVHNRTRLTVDDLNI